MATNVVMPQMGESIAEGTIVRWIKKVGDNVERDEPLFEISTDKVDAEIPSPGAGVLTEIRVKEGETVPVNRVVAVIGGRGRGGPAATADGRDAARGTPGCPRRRSVSPRPVRRRSAVPAAGAPDAGSGAAAASASRTAGRTRSCAGRSRRRSCGGSRASTTSTSAQINGTGISGRVTKQDILGYIETGAEAGPGCRRGAGAAQPSATVPAFKPGEQGRRSCR